MGAIRQTGKDRMGRRSRSLGPWTLATALLISACAEAATPASSTVTTIGTSPAASAYLTEALAEIRDRSLLTDSVDWEMLESAALDSVSGAQSAQDTYPGIELALRLLGDESAVFLAPSEVLFSDHDTAEFDPPVVELNPDGLGYVSVGNFIGHVGDEADRYASDLATRITDIAGQACGWIVDLNTARFGITWPLLAGLAPLLEQGPIGGFTYADGSVDVWQNLGDSVAVGDVVQAHNSRGEPTFLDRPVAVVVGSITGQPGEAVAIAFSTQAQGRLFGQPTRGRGVLVEPIELSDGAVVSLTTARFTDTTGHRYGHDVPVEPDQATPNPDSSEAAATEWLLSEQGCS